MGTIFEKIEDGHRSKTETVYKNALEFPFDIMAHHTKIGHALHVGVFEPLLIDDSRCKITKGMEQ